MTLTYDELTVGPDAYSSEPARGTPPVYTRVYRERGQYAHLREAVISVGCEGEDEYPEWYGTGSQREYEHAARKRLCPKCFAWAHCSFDDPRLGTAHGEVMT
jgi:hypothetical protein